MSIGLLGLLDDVAAIAKVAVASLDDVAAQATKAGAKAAAVVIDDAAVTPRYVFGFSAGRELPIVGRFGANPYSKPTPTVPPSALAKPGQSRWVCRICQSDCWSQPGHPEER